MQWGHDTSFERDQIKALAKSKHEPMSKSTVACVRVCGGIHSILSDEFSGEFDIHPEVKTHQVSKGKG